MDKNKYKYFCDACNYGTDIRYSLIQHNKSVLHQTGIRGKKSIKEKEIYQCTDCEYKSNNKNNYLSHKLNNHSTKDERINQFTYYCKYCDFGVFTESSLTIHNESKRHKRLYKIN